MNEADARAVLLVRAVEDAPGSALTRAEAMRAGDEAHRDVGAAAPFEAWLASRARAVVTRLERRGVALAATLHAAGWSGWITAAAVLIAFVAGIATDAIGPHARINILAPPLLALLVWNVAVYVVLVGRWLVAGRVPVAAGALRRALMALFARVFRFGRRTRSSAGALPLGDFAAAWARASDTLYAARVATMLHAAAAALVAGALGSLYLRGLAFEYRAGWESTFLGATNVHALLATVLGPAARLSGIALPDVEQIAALRFSEGPGENAARWIHLYAITLALVVLVPRTVLALAAMFHARRLARNLPLPLGDAYFERLRRAWSGKPAHVHVLPYSYRLEDGQRDSLLATLQDVVAPRVEMTVADPLPLGAEDDLAHWIAPAAASPDAVARPILAALFPLTATPEREQHGAFVRALAAQHHDDRLLVLIDESGFRRRFPGAGLEARRDERRHAWRAMLAEEHIDPIFVDLSGAAAAEAGSAVQAAP